MTHPTAIARYRRIRRISGSLSQVRELTAIEHLRALGPHGVLSLALRVGEERAATILRVRARQPETGGET